uniref:ATP synthase subunit a n=1 Tax=Naumovozyma dairenensis TaxID=27289 RepID=A0A2D0W3S3_9SACH|nr:ATP synthase F0 subunit a [Naumovozyma dairenensis]APD15108.1 ATP synthase F0 subunit a [Naumovozyma dairenensis]
MLNIMNTFINSPLDQFENNTLLGIMTPFMNLNHFNITTFTLYTLIVFSIILLLYMMTNNNNMILGSKWLLSQEMIYDTMINMIKNQLGGKMWGMYVPLIYTFFMIILVSNLLSMIPYSYALMTQFLFVISMSFMIWLGITILGFYKHGLEFFSLFVPQGTPLVLVPLLVLIEMLSYIMRSLSLGLRLSANIMAGHLLMVILGGMILNIMTINIIYNILGILPMSIVLAVLLLEFAVGMIQAYVWCTLMTSYLKDALFLH